MKKYSFIILVVGLVVLSVSQQKVLMPFVYDIIKSDLFLVDSDDQGGQIPLSNKMTAIAFMHCNNYIKSKLNPDVTVNFSEKPLNTWSLGNYEYVVNAEIGVISNSSTETKKYVCRISYSNGNDEKGSLDFDNWSIVGVSGI